MNTKQRFCIAVVLAGLVALAGSTHAGTIIIPATDRGSINDSGLHDDTTTNYFTGAGEFHSGAGSFTIETSALSRIN